MKNATYGVGASYLLLGVEDGAREGIEAMPEREAKVAANREKAEAFTQQARNWIGSQEGQQRVTTALDKAVQATERLQAARRVDPHTLNERVTR